MTDPTLARALRAMAHPLTLGWVLVLILNDHVLRWRWPGWVTGKLGDVAWLAFAPLVVAVGLALVTRERARGRRILAVAIGLVGVVFVLVKAVSPVTAAFRAGFEAVFGWAPLLVHDPTDLLALPVLGYAWWIWTRVRTPRPVVGSAAQTQNPRWAWGAVGLAALVTLANAAAPDEGILCLRTTDDGLIAGPRYGYAMERSGGDPADDPRPRRLGEELGDAPHQEEDRGAGDARQRQQQQDDGDQPARRARSRTPHRSPGALPPVRARVGGQLPVVIGLQPVVDVVHAVSPHRGARLSRSWRRA